MKSLLTALRQGGDMVVPPNRPLGIFFGLAILGMTGVLGLVSISASSADEWSEYLTYGTVLAVFGWILLLLASTRVVGAGDQLKIVNFFTTISVPASRVRGVDALNGLVVVLDDERRIECVAYGSSVLQDFIPALRPDRHVARLEEWASAHGGGPGEGRTSSLHVRTTVRTYVWCAFPVLWLGSMTYMTVIRAAAGPLRALLQVPMP